MTKPARLTQDEIDRALRGFRKLELTQGRIVIDYARQTVELSIGESHDAPPPQNPLDRLLEPR